MLGSRTTRAQLRLRPMVVVGLIWTLSSLPPASITNQATARRYHDFDYASEARDWSASQTARTCRSSVRTEPMARRNT